MGLLGMTRGARAESMEDEKGIKEKKRRKQYLQWSETTTKVEGTLESEEDADPDRARNQAIFWTGIIGLPVALFWGIFTDNFGWWNYDADGKKFDRTPGRYDGDDEAPTPKEFNWALKDWTKD